jgi:LCP family protein required for cell wall assembly
VTYGRPTEPSRGRGTYGKPGGGKGVKPRWGRIALVGSGLLLVCVLLVTGCLYWYAKSLNDDLARTDPFSDITGGRPAKTVDGSLNILMLGSDSRDPEGNTGDNGAARTDTIIVMHIPASHDKAYLVSIPRDMYVNVPKSADGKFGGHKAKINASYAWGGLPLMVQTVEGFTGVRMDHVVVIDFFGFQDVTDALGGVDLYIEQDVKSIHTPYRQFKKGTQHLNGEEALDYVRQRYQFKEGDFARVRHQQEFLKALMDKAVSTGTVTNPAKLNAFLKAATKAITVDQDFSLVDMALQFRNLRSDKLTFLTSPYSGTDTINGESVVLSDREKGLALYEAMKTDKMAEWAQANASPPAKPGN